MSNIVNKGFALNNKISLKQIQVLLFLEIFGFGVTDLPRRVAEQTAQDGWVSVLLGTATILPMVFVITTVVKRHPGLTFYELACRLLTKPLGIAVALLFVARLSTFAAFNLRIFAEITRQTLLPTTPALVVFVSMLALSAYGASKGIEGRARTAEVLIIAVVVPLVLVFAVSSRDIDFTNLAPAFTSAPENLLRGTIPAFFAFSGMEVLLLSGPFLSRPRNLTRSAISAIAVVGGFMAIITAAVIARFGPANVVHQMWPLLKMMDTANLPGSIIERQGALIMTFWIISAYAVINASLFFSSILLKDVVNKGRHSWYIFATAAIIGLIAALPKNIVQVYEYQQFFKQIFGIGTMVVVPVLMLVVSLIRRGKHS